MTEEQHHEYITAMKEEVRASVTIVVNGKIDKMNEKFDAYVISDNKWKAEAKPALDAFGNMSTTWKALTWFFGGIGVFASAVVMLIRLLKGQ